MAKVLEPCLSALLGEPPNLSPNDPALGCRSSRPAEDSGMSRWFEVQADDFCGFLFKRRIITTHHLSKPIATPVGRSFVVPRWVNSKILASVSAVR
jgi:hypothetical protein